MPQPASPSASCRSCPTLGQCAISRIALQLFCLWHLRWARAPPFLQVQKFKRQLREVAPAESVEWSGWRTFPGNSEEVESRILSYVIQGLHRSLPDVQLVRLGDRARYFALASFGAMVLFVVATVIATSSPTSCLHVASAHGANESAQGPSGLTHPSSGRTQATLESSAHVER
jgi:hypothetical protein